MEITKSNIDNFIGLTVDCNRRLFHNYPLTIRKKDEQYYYVDVTGTWVVFNDKDVIYYDTVCLKLAPEKAKAILLAQQEREKPKPLTLDELRECCETRTAIYVCNIDKSPMFKCQIYCAAVLDIIPAFGSPTMHLQAIYGRNLTLAEGDYNITWLAYRHKPKEATT